MRDEKQLKDELKSTIEKRKELCNHQRQLHVTEINKLLRREANIYINLNQLKQIR